MAATVSAKSVLSELKSLGKPSYKKVMLNHGAREPIHGVAISELKKIQKRAGGTNHTLALELWDSGTPQLARSGDTLQTLAALNGVPLWSLTQANQYSDSAPLSVGQRVLVPRRLVPPVATAAVSRPKR